MLVEMDGFETNLGVIVMAATNRPDILDPALLRPGRFDRQVYVTLPDVRGREQILNVHMRKVPVGQDIRADILARGTPGFSGADLANLVNEAALFAARRNGRVVEMVDFEKAKDKIMMGPERKSMVMPEEERRNTAYHEAGHALVARLMPKTDPVHKVTVIPRGRALGVTMQLPEGDRYSMDKERMLSTISVLFGGRIAEEVFMNQMTTGASNDFERATQIARDMVTRYGMTDELGPMVYAENEGEVFLGRSVTKTTTMSEETMRKVDEVIRRIIDEQYTIARKHIEDNQDKMHAMAKALLEWETIDAEQIEDIMNGKPPRPPKDWSNTPTRPGGGATPPQQLEPALTLAWPQRCGRADCDGALGPVAAFYLGQTSAGAGRGNFNGAHAAPCQIRAVTAVRPMLWHTTRFTIDLARPQVMGIVNVTPDSFSDGGQHASSTSAQAHCEKLLADGADILDIGGESTRPGSVAPPVEVEIARVLPVVRFAINLGVPISVDTSRPEVMAEVLDAGADIINDVRALRWPGALDCVVRHGAAGVCLMHMQGDPQTMQQDPQYADVAGEVAGFLGGRLQAVQAAGVAAERIVLDPGYGFGKALEHNLELFRRQASLLALGRPLLVGWSRKGTLGQITGRPAGQRM
eukprot:gene38534-50607_t